MASIYENSLISHLELSNTNSKLIANLFHIKLHFYRIPSGYLKNARSLIRHILKVLD